MDVQAIYICKAAIGRLLCDGKPLEQVSEHDLRRWCRESECFTDADYTLCRLKVMFYREVLSMPRGT